MGVACMGIVRIPRHLKGELAWATDQQLWVINDTMLIKTVTPLRINE